MNDNYPELSCFILTQSVTVPIAAVLLTHEGFMLIFRLLNFIPFPSLYPQKPVTTSATVAIALN